MTVRKMDKKDFLAFRDFYVRRLNVLREEIIKLNREAHAGMRGKCEAMERMKEIDTEVKGIIECGVVMNYLRHQ